MIGNQIKSGLRNKSNKIYIITFMVLFIILNISLNIGKIVDSYYDSKMEDIINANEENEKYSRTIYTIKEITLTEQEKKDIMNLKNVKDIETEIKDWKIGIINEETGKAEFVDTKITINYIIVDNWKNCKSVQDYFDSKGIETRILLSQFEIYKNYNTVKTFSIIVSYILIGMFILMITICYKNILKTEEENINLLKIIGYSKRKIRNIMSIFIMIMLIVGYILAISVLSTFYNVQNILVIEEVIINVILTIIPLLIIIYIKIKNI